jgi:putative transposase
LIEPGNGEIAVARQCELLALARSSYYYRGGGESAGNLELMRRIDEQYLRTPFYGSPRMTAVLKRMGYAVNHKRVERLMRVMGIVAVYPKKKTSQPHPENKIYPYLLSNLKIRRPDQVWGADITYVRLTHGFVFLVVVMDWHSRYVLSWELSILLDKRFCLEALDEALRVSRPEIFNTDQGGQFTSLDFTGRLEAEGIRISMDGRGRVFDNIFIERLWRTVKYEEVYLHSYETVEEARRRLSEYFVFYNTERLHSSLGYRTPHEVYFRGSTNAAIVPLEPRV